MVGREVDWLLVSARVSTFDALTANALDIMENLFFRSILGGAPCCCVSYKDLGGRV